MSDTESAAAHLDEMTLSPEEEAAKAARKAAKKAQKEKEKAEKAARAALRAQQQADVAAASEDDPLRERYGDAEMVQSRAVTGRVWTPISALGAAKAGESVLVRARVHNVRGKGKSAFMVLRDQTSTVQVTLFVDDVAVSKGMVKYACALSRESIVDVEGTLVCPEQSIESCSQSDVEIEASGVRCISRAAALPFDVVDAARSAEEVRKGAEEGVRFVTVQQDVRLNSRYVDLRTPANNAIFRVQSMITQLFRESLLREDFVEIHTPKLLAGASEGGAAVFRFQYMGQDACLAQSPQFYKQMAICSDFPRVFEVGPVFRAENSFTHRHLCEFTGLDMEMCIYESYHEVLDVLDRLFVHMFEGLNKRCARELNVIGGQYPFEPLKFLKKSLRLTFAEGIQMLQEAGHEVDPFGDLNTELERALGKLVRDKYDTDFYMLHRYPAAIRPFYTMPCPDDARYSNSYDIFIRGEEIISGAQRIHDPVLLEKRAAELGVPVEQIQSYIDCFKHGAPPHGGAGVGLERVVMLFCGLDNIRKTSMYPRDPKRLAP